MKFTTTNSDEKVFSFKEALEQGYPSDGGFFYPSGQSDLRSVIYAPHTGYKDVMALATASVLAGDFDPHFAMELSDKIFTSPPPLSIYDDKFLIFDLAGGATGSIYDYGASFFAALLAQQSKSGEEFVVAAVREMEAAALATAFAKYAPQYTLILLCPDATIRGIKPELLYRNGGKVILAGVRGHNNRFSDRATFLERQLVGKSLLGHRVIPGGAATPARLLSRALLFIGLFAQARENFVGELIVPHPPFGVLGIVTSFWAWSWGIPISSFVTLSYNDEACEPASVLENRSILRRFYQDFPLSSLEQHYKLGETDISAAREVQAKINATSKILMDIDSVLALNAAERFIKEEQLEEISKVLVPRFVHPYWETNNRQLSIEVPMPDFARDLVMTSSDFTIAEDSGALEEALKKIVQH